MTIGSLVWYKVLSMSDENNARRGNFIDVGSGVYVVEINKVTSPEWVRGQTAVVRQLERSPDPALETAQKTQSDPP